MTIDRLILDIAGKGLSCQLDFNGVPLAQHALREHLARSFVLNGWVVNGPNQLGLRLGALPLPPVPDAEPAQQAMPEPAPGFTLSLRAVPPGGAEQLLVDYAWRATDLPLLPTLAVALNERVDLQAAAVWTWTRGAPMAAPGADDRQAITGLLAALHGALERRAIDEVVQFQRQSLVEQALAQGAQADAMLVSYTAFLRQRMADPSWQVRPVDWSGLRSVPLADGRVHRMTDARGAPPIVTLSGGSSFAIDPCVAKVDGQWQIVR